MTDLTKRLQRYVRVRREMPLTQLGDSIHCVHTGTEHEAELRLSDLTAGVSLLENLTQENARLSEALEETLRVYVELAESGDAGFWDPEKEPHVIAARKALGGGDEQ